MKKEKGDSSYMGIGEKIHLLRTQRGLYQKELSHYLNVSISTISNYEKGMYQPDLDTICRLADFFCVTTDYLLDRTSDPTLPADLSEPLMDDYTASDLVETAKHLSSGNLYALIAYAKYLKDTDPKK